MLWIQFFGFILILIGIFLWNHKNAKAYRTEEFLLRKEMICILKEIIEEQKAFHTRSLLIQDPFSRVKEKKENKK